MFRMRFWPMTARPMSAMSALGSMLVSIRGSQYKSSSVAPEVFLQPECRSSRSSVRREGRFDFSEWLGLKRGNHSKKWTFNGGRSIPHHVPVLHRRGNGGLPLFPHHSHPGVETKTNRPMRLRTKGHIMKSTQSETVGSFLSPAVRVTVPLLALLLVAAVAHGHGKQHGDRHKEKPPKVPEGLQVPAGNEVQFHVSGVGVQIYVWTINPTNTALSSWVFKAPHAVLFGTEKDEKGDVVGIHFGGPTWE